jgi:hypothetical protein
MVVRDAARVIQQHNVPPLASLGLLVGRLAQGLRHTTLPPMQPLGTARGALLWGSRTCVVY